jgi:hypothetical protein
MGVDCVAAALSKFRVVIAGNEYKRDVQHAHEVLEVIERKVATRHDEVGSEFLDPRAVQAW